MPPEEIQIFGVPIAKVFVHETPALKEQFLPEILRRYEAGSFAKPAEYESDRIHTSYGAASKEQVIHPLPSAYDQLLRRFVRTDHFHVKVWHSVYWSGREYQERRYHLPGHFSFLHFLSFDPSEHNRPIFYSPSALIRAHCQNKAIQSEIWSQEEEIELFEGDALVFPAYLEYSVSPGDYRNPMVIVSISVSLFTVDQGRAPRDNAYGD